MANDEKLRLLFIEQRNEYDDRSSSINKGASAIIGRWPSYIASATWCIIFFISFATLLMLLIFTALLKEGKLVEHDFYIPKGGGYIITEEIQSEFCNQMRSKRHEKRQNIPEEDLKLFDSGNNMFFMVMKPLDKFSSCSVETVIKHFPDKNVFIMFLKKVDKYLYENALRAKYSNFNILKVDGTKMLRGSPFEGKWKGDDRSQFRVALLTVWQFGGTVLSENLLMLNRRLLEVHNIDCKVDKDFIFCPMQCAAYMYDLIGVTLRNPPNISIDFLIGESVKQFCGSEHLRMSGCFGVARIGSDEICEIPEENCKIIRTKEWFNGLDNVTAWKNIRDHCPATRKYQIALEKKMTKEKMTTNKPAPSLRIPMNVSTTYQTSSTRKYTSTANTYRTTTT